MLVPIVISIEWQWTLWKVDRVVREIGRVEVVVIRSWIPLTIYWIDSISGEVSYWNSGENGEVIEWLRVEVDYDHIIVVA